MSARAAKLHVYKCSISSIDLYMQCVLPLLVMKALNRINLPPPPFLGQIPRCYDPSCLNDNRTAYKQGSGCTDYCTRDGQIEQILKSCTLPPPPPPPPPPPLLPPHTVEVFTPGELGYPCIRIPSILLSGDGLTLNAFAECRNFTGDGCEPHAVGGTSELRNANRDICQKQSTDNGTSWSPLKVIVRAVSLVCPIASFVCGLANPPRVLGCVVVCLNHQYESSIIVHFPLLINCLLTYAVRICVYWM